jgi:transcriptional regulator with XRE-family HTH domain
MAHFGRLTYARPFTALGLQEGLDFGVQVGAHAGIIVKDSLIDKEHFPSPSAHAQWMQGKDINLVVAENLRHWMRKAEVTQAHLAALAGVSQKTISNYLNPYQRTAGSSGKQGSPKLFELDLIARSLGIEVWQLTREMSGVEREVYDAIEKAFALASRSAANAAPLLPASDDLKSHERESSEDERMAREVLDRSNRKLPRKRSP